MKPVIVINRLALKPGAIDEFIEAQLNYASALMKKPTGLTGSRLYRGLDERTVVWSASSNQSRPRRKSFSRPHSRRI